MRIGTLLVLLLLSSLPARADQPAGCEALGTPGCGGCKCEACVCQHDPFCCTIAWDAVCVSRCQEQCSGCGPASPCGDGTCSEDETCGNCPFDCGTCPIPCGDIPTKGCCIGTNLAVCQGGELVITTCGSNEPPNDTCGWSLDEKSYVCGGAGHDPTGTWPLECPENPDPPDVVTEGPEECQGLTWKGCCQGETLYWCSGTELLSLDCSANPAPHDTCGWVGGENGNYDCGGAGEDPSGVFAQACAPSIGDTADVAPPAECSTGELVQEGCEDIGFAGCCTDDGELLFCEDGKLLCRLYCNLLQPPNNTCGWFQAGQTGFYDCGGDGIDPSGQNPLSCPQVGPDPDVVSDTTEDVQTTACPDLPESGCCDGSLLHYCKDGHVQVFDCASMADDPVYGDYIHCGKDPSTGQVTCGKKPDPLAPACEVTQPDTAEPAPDTIEPTPDSVESPPEVVEHTPETISPDTVTKPDTPPPTDTTPWIPDTGTTPEPQVEKDDSNGNGGGGGCTTTQTPTIPWSLLLLCVLVLVRRKSIA